MKLRIYFRPEVPVVLLTAAAGASWLMARLGGIVKPLWLALALFYTALACIAIFSIVIIWAKEKTFSHDRPERLLVLAPHEDDCVICAGGLAICNQRLGGETFVAYLAEDEKPGMPERRRREAIAAWQVIGVPADHLFHLNVLPRLSDRRAWSVEKARKSLRGLLDSVRPTMVVMPLFEGGHIHHDLTNFVMSFGVDVQPETHLFEAPEYSPYVSLVNTPHRVIMLCTRWLFGLVAYYPPPDTTDRRQILTLNLSKGEISLKKEMFRKFESQNGWSLAETHSYPDRLLMWQRRPFQSQPFRFAYSYPWLLEKLQQVFPSKLVRRFFPGQLATYGLERGITNLDAYI